jgi:hypothetical protein
MKENNSRREFLSQSGKMVTAAALFGTSVPLAHAAVSGTIHCDANNTMKITDPHYYLDNVLLETGFDYENGVAVQTRTAHQTVEIQNGKIVALRENKQHPDATLPHYDAGGIFDNAVATNGNDHKFFHVVMSATEGDGVMRVRLPLSPEGRRDRKVRLESQTP